MRQLERRIVLLGAATAWAVPALTTVSVAEAVGSPAPSGVGGSGVLGVARVLAAGTATIRWKDAAGDPAGPVPRAIGPTTFGPGPKPMDARAVLAGDSLGLTAATWTRMSTNLFGGQLYPTPGGPTDITPGHWYTAGVVLFTFYVYPRAASAVEETFTWPDVWCVFLRP